MLADGGFITCALTLPRRNALITADVDAAFWGLAGAGFAPDNRGQMRIAEERRIPEISGETTRARLVDGAVNIDQAIRALRRVPADFWGQIMLRGQFAIGGRFEAVTAVVCPFSAKGAGLFSAHLLFRDPGLLIVDREAPLRASHALEALGRLGEAMSPIFASMDTKQFAPDADALKAGRIPWLPWAGYMAPGALRTIGGGGLTRLPEWIHWLENAMEAKGAGGTRKTAGGGLMWALPETGLGRRPRSGDVDGSMAPWWQYLSKVVGAQA